MVLHHSLPAAHMWLLVAGVPAPRMLPLVLVAWSGTNTLQTLGLLLCLFLSALANGAETALTSIGRIKSRTMLDQGVKGSEIVADLTRDPNRFLSAILILNSVAVIVASTLATLLMVAVLGIGVGGIVAPVVTSLVVLVFVEIVPKTVAIHTAEASALRYARPVRALTRILNPMIVVLRAITDGVMRIRGITPRAGPFVTEEELISLVTLSEQQGVIEEEEKEMIHGVIDFEETIVREVMVPRVRITGIRADRSLREAVDIAIEDGHSRLPTYEETIDRISGILYVKDMLRALARGNLDISLRELARKAFEVPETKHVGELFREFQARKTHIAIVVDESGGTAGLVTIEDLLEEIVGDIQDEYDKPGEEPTIEQIGPDEFIVDARINLEDLDDATGIDLAAEDYDTLNGFILDQLGALPIVGSEVNLEGKALFTVVSVQGRRADKVRISRLANSEPAPDPVASEAGQVD